MEIIDHNIIKELLTKGAQSTPDQQRSILARSGQPSVEEVASLLFIEDKDMLETMYRQAGEIKRSIYGDRMVIFAPLYISNHCVNNCTYCGYKRDNELPRRRLTMTEIRQEVKALEAMGHKRIALEVGEDPVNCPIDYVIEAIRTIYDTKTETGAIRRINVNIAATSVENYKRLHQENIGTYILFQETYHQETYESVHKRSLKSDYLFHLGAFDRAMQGGVDDVGAGVLFGLYDWRYEVLGLLMHNQWLEQKHGVGFHTISVPRMKRAEGVSLTDFPYLIDDTTFRKIIAILRIAVPYTGIILSTRESAMLRDALIHLGVSQVSAGSSTGVGGYRQDEQSAHTEQFEVEDKRPPLQVIKELIRSGYVPSYCTACYRSGRTGDRFMSLAKSGNIQNVCHPNALMTLAEYAYTFGDTELKTLVQQLTEKEIHNIHNPKMREYTAEAIEKINQGETDFFV